MRKGGWLLIIALLLLVFVLTLFILQRRSANQLIGLLRAFGNVDKLHAIMGAVSSDYVDSVNLDSMENKVAQLFLKQLDPHSEFFTSEEMEAVSEPLRGDFDGIGVTYNMVTDTVIVQSVIAGGPSERAGILMGDRFLSVDGHRIVGKKVTTDSVMHLLRGARGTKVVVGLERSGVPDTLAIEITRDRIPLTSVEIAYMANEQTGVIRLSRFAQTTPREFQDAIRKLAMQGMQRLVLDLRRNGGGFLEAACFIAMQFLQQGQLIVYTEGRARSRQEIRTESEGVLRNIPLVVLVDEYSASSSEIVAGAMQDNDRALIIGRRTFGKGLVQEQRMFADGSGIRLTVARYYTPSGRCIQKPYKLGENEKYNEEWLERLVHGELLHSDSIHQDTLQRFTTTHGRVVYGGGGIVPDVFVPLDTVGFSAYYKSVTSKGLPYRFTQRYVDQHREFLQQFSDWQQLDVYLRKQNLLQQFDVFARKDDPRLVLQGHGRAERLLEIQLRALVVRGILDNKGYYPIIQELDTELQKALELVASNQSLSVSAR